MEHAYDITLWTLALTLIIGVASNLLAKKIKVAPIVFFLGLGMLLGKSGLDWINPDTFGDHFVTLISLGIAIILFEAGLTLDYANYKRVDSIVIKMLTLGMLFSWIVNAFAIHYIFSFDLKFSFLASSLIIVTGPTVIMPILRKINVTKKIFHILHWEGVMIDPIGVFLALLSYEIYIGVPTGDSWLSFIGGGEAFIELGLRVVLGVVLGVVFGTITATLLNRRWIPYEFMNAFVLAMAVLTFSVCDIVIAESGLLGVIVAGLITGFRKNIHIDEIKKFKLEITNLFIGLIFVLIASGLDLSNINRFGWKGVIVLLVVIFISRPVNVFISGYKSNLSLKEKLFLSWLSPRGIVAASLATLLTFSLANEENISQVNHWFIQSFTFAVIITTVLFQGFSAGFVAKLLKLVQVEKKEWVIIGAHDFSEVIARSMMRHEHSVTIVDNNKNRVEVYQKRGLEVIYLDSLSTDIYEDSRLLGTSHLLALTDNIELNALTCQHWKRIVSSKNLYRWGELESASNQQWEGKVVWDYLPKPTIISNDLLNGNCYFKEDIVEKTVDLTNNPLLSNAKRVPLLKLDVDQFEMFDSNAEIKINEKADEPVKCLYLIRGVDDINALYDPDLVFIEDNNKVIKETKVFYEKLIEKLKINYANILSPNQLDELLVKEKDQSYCLGNEVAIIHIHHSKIHSPIIGLAVIRKGINLNAFDLKPVKLAYILISPKGDSSKHLWVISEISKKVNREDYRNQLIASKSEHEVLDYLSNSK